MLHDLYRIENVGTWPVERITSNDEERRRQGFEIQTTFAFNPDGSRYKQAVADNNGIVVETDFAQAATISRINKGLRRRRENARIGFYIDPKSGSWVGEKSGPSGKGGENRPDEIKQLIVPMVEDRKNALLLRFPRQWLSTVAPRSEAAVATVQHALARGIEAVFQLEEGEILVEPVPAANERKALLFYESAEGGAGALAQLAGREGGLDRVARSALEIMHYDPDSFEAARSDVKRLKLVGNPECVAGCYRCVLSYFNQPDHELIDRRSPAALDLLLRLAFAEYFAETAPETVVEPSCQLPPHDKEPLVVDGRSFAHVWRKWRIVVLDEWEYDGKVAGMLSRKGVRVMERPAQPELRKAFELELADQLSK